MSWLPAASPMIAPQIRELAGEGFANKVCISQSKEPGLLHGPIASDLMSISPKLKNSVPITRDGGRWAGQHERLRYQPEVLKGLMTNYPYQLKFVVGGRGRSI